MAGLHGGQQATDHEPAVTCRGVLLSDVHHQHYLHTGMLLPHAPAP